MKITYDPDNPGHVLACCGALVLAQQVAPSARSWFDPDSGTFEIDGVDALPRVVSTTVVPTTEFEWHEAENAAKPVIRLDLENDAWVTLDWWRRPMVSESALWKGRQSPLLLMLRPATKSDPVTGVLDSDGPWVPDIMTMVPDPREGGSLYDTRGARNKTAPGSFGHRVSYSVVTDALALVGLQYFSPEHVVSDGRTLWQWTTWRLGLRFPVAAALFHGVRPALGIDGDWYAVQVAATGSVARPYRKLVGTTRVRIPSYNRTELGTRAVQ